MPETTTTLQDGHTGVTPGNIKFPEFFSHFYLKTIKLVAMTQLQIT